MVRGELFGTHFGTFFFTLIASFNLHAQTRPHDGMNIELQKPSRLHVTWACIVVILLGLLKVADWQLPGASCKKISQ